MALISRALLIRASKAVAYIIWATLTHDCITVVYRTKFLRSNVKGVFGERIGKVIIASWHLNYCLRN